MNGTQSKLTFILAVIFLFSYAPCKAQEYPTIEENEWADENYFGVFEEKFAIPQNRSSVVSYRMHRDLYSEIEYSFEIFSNSSASKSLSASVKMADGAPLYEQMIMLRRKDSSATIETIKSQLKITEIFLNEETCPAIRRQNDEFEKLSLETLSAKERANRKKGIVLITLHPRVYTFKARISGGTLTLTLTDSDNSFVKWAEKTRKAFEACTQPQNK